jgi:hypothetical protein
MCYGNCHSENIVYIIKCKKFSVYYVGESKRKAKIRINEHLNNIRRYQRNIAIKISKLNSITETETHLGTILRMISDFIFLKRILMILRDFQRKRI